MDTQQAQEMLAFSFSHEELVVLLKLLGLVTLPGLSDDLFADYKTSDQYNMLLAAQRSLQARGILAVTAEQVQVDQTMAGILYAAASARAVFTRFYTPLDGSVGHKSLYYVSRGFVIELTPTVEGVHYFRVLPSLTSTAAIMLSILPTVAAGRFSVEPLSFPLAALESYRKAVDTQQDSVNVLCQAGIDAKTAQVIDELLNQTVATFSFISIDLGPLNAESQMFSVFQTDSALWLLTVLANGSGEFQPTNSVNLSKRLIEMFKVTLPDLFAA